jgi:hypothetical protein
MANNREVKTLVSPTLSPINITSMEGYEEAKEYVAHAVTALDTSYQSVEAVITARQKMALDESRTERARMLMVAELAEKYTAKVQKAFESSWDKLDKGIRHTEQELSKPVEEYAGIGNVATEIRAHLKAMTQGERMKFLSDALEQNDSRTLQSALGAPSYLSGMSATEHTHYTRLYHDKQSPEVTARLAAMKGAIERLERAKPVVLQEFASAVGANRREIEKLRAASNAAEAALVMKDFAPVQD